ncbi:hypothetical protein MRX96_032721 [Rhipicephalus microplus]
MAIAQQGDSKLRVLRLQENFLKLKDIQLPGCAIPLVCDTSAGCPRPYVPAAFRRSVFDALRSFSNPGIRATQHLITGWHLWPRMNIYVRRWTRACLKCQLIKVKRKRTSSRGGLRHYSSPTSRQSQSLTDSSPCG